MRSVGAHASGAHNRGSVLTVIADAVEDFKPDHMLLALRSAEHANWQERGLEGRLEKRFGLPLISYAVDPRGHATGAQRGRLAREAMSRSATTRRSGMDGPPPWSHGMGPSIGCACPSSILPAYSRRLSTPAAADASRWSPRSKRK